MQPNNHAPNLFKALYLQPMTQENKPNSPKNMIFIPESNGAPEMWLNPTAIRYFEFISSDKCPSMFIVFAFDHEIELFREQAIACRDQLFALASFPKRETLAELIQSVKDDEEE